MQTLFEVLSNDERIIVYSDQENKTIYTWNQSLTLQAWDCHEFAARWEEVSIRTLAKEPKNYAEARIKAIEWAVEGVTDDR